MHKKTNQYNPRMNPQQITPCTGKVCDECPYRKTAPPGYFGGYSIDEYRDPLIHDILVPCHKTHGKEERPLCTGLVAVRVNGAKRAKVHSTLIESENAVRELPEAREQCFDHVHQFTEYHKRECKTLRLANSNP